MNTKNSKLFVDDFMNYVRSKDPGQPEFHQAVHEVVESLADFLLDNPRYLHVQILERMVEAERIIQFRVPWIDDRGKIHINRQLSRVRFALEKRNSDEISSFVTSLPVTSETRQAIEQLKKIKNVGDVGAVEILLAVVGLAFQDD